MPPNPDYTEVMKMRSNDELLEIIVDLRADYEPDAVKAAENELKHRNLDEEGIIEASSKLTYRKELRQKVANEPLPAYRKLQCFFLPGLGMLLRALLYQGKGEERKYREAWKWTFYGFGFYTSLIILIFLINN